MRGRWRAALGQRQSGGRSGFLQDAGVGVSDRVVHGEGDGGAVAMLFSTIGVPTVALVFSPITVTARPLSSSMPVLPLPKVTIALATGPSAVALPRISVPALIADSAGEGIGGIERHRAVRHVDR